MTKLKCDESEPYFSTLTGRYYLNPARISLLSSNLAQKTGTRRKMFAAVDEFSEAQLQAPSGFDL
jgi:hypothetical protein